jgi:flagellar biosynthesis/type III secretory pathway protein FliH
MHVRIAEFEADAASLDQMVDGVRESLQQGREGGTPEGMSEEQAQGMSGVTRVMMMVDRESGKLVNLVFTETEDEMRRADEALNSMSPPGDGPRRIAVGKYEVAIDQPMR